jgi:UDP-GlcNAc:undecaprenyl-phosphate GlcNAc-1-phosphate transferase
MSWIDGSVITASVTLLLLLALRPVAFAAGLVDRPGGRKLHVGIVPVSGGICMWLGVAIALPLTQSAGPGTLVFLLASGLLLLIGVIDDRFDLAPRIRLIAQACAALLMCLGADLVAPSLGDILFIGEIRLGMLATPFTVLVAVSLINAFNMMDGLDGLAGSMGLAALVPAAVVSGLAGASGSLTLGALLLCAVFAFLVFNFPLPFNRPVRTFMGDAGSTVIGFGVVWIGTEMSHGHEATISPVAALWLAALPIYDLFISFGRRLRNGQSPMSPDRGHLHHILQNAGLEVREIVLVMGGAGIVVASIGLCLDALGVHDGVMFVGLIALGLCQAWICNRAHLVARLVGRRRSIKTHIIGEPSVLRQASAS